MSSSLPWLATLLRVREHRRDAALKSLAQSLQAATNIRDTTSHVASVLARLGQAQQQISQSGRLDPDRLQHMRKDRDSLRTQKTELLRQQAVAETAVRQAQVNAAAKDAEADVLRRLQDRINSAHRQAQRRRDEQTPSDVADSLCNGRLSG